MMPGYFISDTGEYDAHLFITSKREEKDFSKIQIREDYFKAIRRVTFPKWQVN
jgi:hypothetical protein